MAPTGSHASQESLVFGSPAFHNHASASSESDTAQDLDDLAAHGRQASSRVGVGWRLYGSVDGPRFPGSAPGGRDTRDDDDLIFPNLDMDSDQEPDRCGSFASNCRSADFSSDFDRRSDVASHLAVSARWL